MQSAKNRELNQKHEAMAQGMAAGLTKKAAAIAAGYAPTSNSIYRVTKRDEFKARVALLRQEREWGGSPDLAPAINMLMRGAEKALAMNTAAAMAAGARMVTEAARLKQKLPKTQKGDLGVEEWLARFGPKS